MHLHQSIRSSFPKFLFHQKRLFAQKLTRINYSQLNKMNDTLPVKQEIDDKHLADESAILHPYISQCYTLYEKKQLQPYDFAGIFILLYCSLRRPKSWSNGQLDLALSINEQELSKENSIKLIKIPYLIESLDINYLSRKLGIPQDSLQFQSLTVADIFSKLQLAGIKKNTDHFINRSIVQWALNRRPFHLMFEIPSPMTVLLQQSRGQRVVTMFRHKHELSTTHVAQLHYMEGSQNHARDAFEFLIHDLKHMENFILADSHVEQVGFFKCMLRLGNGHPRNFFEEICGYDEKLWNELEYVISDMNCFSPHLMQYLLAKMTLASVRRINLLFDEVSSTSSSSSVDMCDHLNKCWTELLVGFGMSTSTDSEVFQVAFDMIATTKRERGVMTVVEADLLRNFFRNEAIKQINDLP